MSGPARPVDAAASAGGAPYCRNCGAPLTGAFCADCGQKGDVHVPTTHELVHDALEGITHSDSRLWVTLKYLLFAPGKLTTEYIAGRRVAYLPPFRLYLVLSVLFFVVASFGGDSNLKIGVLQKSGSSVELSQKTPAQVCADLQTDLGPSAQSHLTHACEGIVKDHGETLLHDVLSLAPKALFVLLPVIAFFNMLLYWRPRERYAVHLLFFVHLHAFVFLAFTLILLAARLGTAVPILGTVAATLVYALQIYLVVYLFRALRKVFHRGIVRTLFKEIALVTIYMVTFSLTATAVFLYAAWQL